jgi:hypothetical protein
VLVAPHLLQARDCRCRQPRRIFAQQGCQRLLEVAGRQTAQVENWQQHIEALGPPCVRRQQRRTEADTLGIASCRASIANPRLANRQRAQAGQDLALRQMAVTHDASTAVLRPEIDVATQEHCHLGLDGLRQKGPRPGAQHFGQRVFERPWLHELDNGIVGHGVSLLCWRSGGIEHPHDTPPSSLHAVTNFRS